MESVSRVTLESASQDTFSVRYPCGHLYTFPLSSLPRWGAPTPIRCSECGRLFSWSETESRSARKSARRNAAPLRVVDARSYRASHNPKPTPRDIDWVGCYRIGYWIFFFLIFVGCWIYCMASYGFLIGVGIGWLPSIITAAIVSLFWPLIVLAVAALVAYLGFSA